MAKIEIKKDDFDEWARNSWQQYASESISRGKLLKRLRFMVSFDSEYKITFGNDLLYQGYDFNKAKEAYEGVY